MAARKLLLAPLFVIGLVLFKYGSASESVLCTETFCRTYGFDVGCSAPAASCGINNATHTGLWMLSPTECNCCDFCLGLFLEGQPCSLGGPGDGVTIGRCGAGLTCVADAEGNRCRRMQSTCHSLQDEFDARQARGEVGFLEERPRCDDKGRFAPAACIPTQTCYCQSEDGERIFGEAEYKNTNSLLSMQCGCSRLNEAIDKNIGSAVRLPVIGPRCTQDGSFSPVQCDGRLCRCVNRITGVVTGNHVVDLNTQMVSELSCYDESLDTFAYLTPEDAEPPYNYTTPCFEEREDRMREILQSEEDGYIVDFFTTIMQCLPDGSYTRVSVELDGRKICTNALRDQIENYHAMPGTSAYDSMDCRCAQTSLILLSNPERPVCCQNGNFRPVQCRRGACYCVDSHGRQQGKEQQDVTLLSCFTQNWRSC